MRKAEHLKSASDTREALWNTIRRAKEFTIRDLLLNSTLDKSTVAAYVKALVKAKKLAVCGSRVTDGGTRPTYRLVQDSIEPPRVRPDGTIVTQGQGRRHMWKTIRKSRLFSLADLVAKSSTPTHPVSFEEAETYIRYLEKAAYIRNEDGRPRPRALFRLIKDTGPLEPMVQRIKQVWDQNLKKVVWPVQGGDK